MNTQTTALPANDNILTILNFNKIANDLKREAVNVYLVVILPRKSGFLDHGTECYIDVLTAEQTNAVGCIVGLAIPFKQRKFDKRSPCLESRI